MCNLFLSLTFLSSGLPEWITFHLLAGVSRFYIFYDTSDDNTLQVLRAYAAATNNAVRIYDITSLPGHAPGAQPYPHAEHSFRDVCLRSNPDRVQWMAFIDADEFLFPRDGAVTVTAGTGPGATTAPNTLATHLIKECAPYKLSHIAVRNRFFGSSGLAVRPKDHLLIEDFLRFNSFVVGSRSGTRRIVHKMIANTACIEAMATHYPTRVRSESSVNLGDNSSNGEGEGEGERGEDGEGEGNGDSDSHVCRIIYSVGEALGSAGPRGQTALAVEAHNRCAKGLRLNHYVTRSRAEFVAKYRKGKLSQAAKETKWGIDRIRFVKLFGTAFVRGGLEGLKAAYEQYRTQNSFERAKTAGAGGGVNNVDGRGGSRGGLDPLKRALSRFYQEFKTKDGNRYYDDAILRYSHRLRASLKSQLPSSGNQAR